MIHSFLLVGQSNMAGRGFPNEVEPIENKRIKVLRNGRWQPMYVPVNADRSFSGVNLAESFADLYTRDHDAEVGLIPCADGGTRIAQWAEGGLLFDHALYQAELASRTSTIAGVLWHQGEADSFEDRWPCYAGQLAGVLDAFRKRLNLYDVPFLLGGLGDFLAMREDPGGRSLHYPKINAAIKNFFKMKPPYTATAVTKIKFPSAAIENFIPPCVFVIEVDNSRKNFSVSINRSGSISKSL